MKRTKCLILATAILSTAFLGSLQAETLPGQVDFGSFSASASGDFAEINVSSTLISLVSSLVEQKDAEFSQLLKGLHQVRVNVVGLTDQNRADLEKRLQRSVSSWTRTAGSGWCERRKTARMFAYI